MRVIVIGSGPCGLMTATSLRKFHPNMDVILLEKDHDIGSRIKISGNGRCNFINKNLDSNKYSTSFVTHIISYQKDVLNFLDDTGFNYYFDNEGRGYPTSESSLTLIKVFKDLIEQYGVELRTDYLVTSIKLEAEQIIINDDLKCDYLIVACGGISYLNERLNYNRIVSELNLEVTPLTSSLSPLSVSSFPKNLENKKVKCQVSLLCNNRVLKTERGEVLFKKDGLSGIVIFNMSSYLARLHLNNYKGYQLSLNLLPDISDEKLNSLIQKNPLLDHILLKELAEYVYSFGNQANTIRDLRFDVRGIYDFKNSQVTSGGVSLDQLNQNLSLKKDHRIYLGGEFIDVDGDCGGYNIGFALCSGYMIGKEIESEK